MGVRWGGGVGRLDRIGRRKFARVRVRTRVWDRWRRVPVGVVRRAAISALLHLRRTEIVGSKLPMEKARRVQGQEGGDEERSRVRG